MNSSPPTRTQMPLLGQIVFWLVLFSGSLFLIGGVRIWLFYGDRDFRGLAYLGGFLTALALWILFTKVNLRRALVLILLVPLGYAGLYGVWLVSRHAFSWQVPLAQKAMKKMADCKALGDRPVILHGKVFVWQQYGPPPTPEQGILSKSLRYSNGEEPVTVFVVTAATYSYAGKYMMSQKEAYAACRDVFAVEFHDRADEGTPLAYRTVCSLPRETRPVKDSPEYADPWSKVVDWIHSLSGTAMLDASRSGDLGRVESLLADSPDLVSTKDDVSQTPLHLACFYGHKDVAELLLAHGANIHAVDKSGKTPLGCAVAGGHQDVAEFLRQHGGTE